MPATITELLARLQRDYQQLGITLYPPATEAEVLVFEQTKGIRLPADIQAFYLCCNGFESDRELFRFVPLSDNLADSWQRLLMAPSDLFLAEHMIYSDTWALSINPSAPADSTIYNTSEEIVLTTSFAEFLEVAMHHGVLGDGGLYDWQIKLAPHLANPPTILPEPPPPPPRKPWYKFW